MALAIGGFGGNATGALPRLRLMTICNTLITKSDGE